MAWNDLLARLRASTDADVLRFADLLEMDLAGFSKTGHEGTTHGPNYGDNIPTGAQGHFEPKVRPLVSKVPATAQDIVKELAGFFGDPLQKTFNDDCNKSNRCNPGAFRALRYIAVSRFFQNFLRVTPTLPRVGDPKRAVKARDYLDEKIRELDEDSKVYAALANPKRSGRVWVTRSDCACPHEVARARGLSEAETCNFVVQQMGLLGFDNVRAKQEHLGMIALEYISNIEMYRPTVLDALPSLDDKAMVLAFYPGPKGKDHGETLPLEVSLSAPGTRALPGVPEWIHAVEEVRLRDISPGELKETWHCRVAWSGLW
jgi:hypothetical protein